FKLIEIHVPTELPYSSGRLAPAFQFFDEMPLNLRSSAGDYRVYDLPFEFPFYGRSYSSVQVHPNGLLTFEVPADMFGRCVALDLLADVKGIAPLLLDVRTNGSAQPNENVYVSRPSADAIAFRWAGETNPLPGLFTPEPVNFAATLFRDGRIEFSYGSGNRNLSFSTNASNAFGCSAESPLVGIASGRGTAAAAIDYIGRSNLENAQRVFFEPSTGATSAPSIRIEAPNAADTYEGILQTRITVYDANHPVFGGVYVLIDGLLLPRPTPSPRPEACTTERLPNCSGWMLNSNFETLNLSPGPHTMKVIAVNSRGGASEREVTFQVGAGQSRVPRVVIEAPAADAEVTGNVTFRGWAAADNLRILGIDVLIDGVNYGRAAYGMSRADVCQGLGFTSPNCPGIGFQFSVNSVTGAIPLPNGEHLVQIRIQDETGRFTLYPETPLAFRVNNEANLPPTGVLVTPRHNDRLSGTVLIYGYAWDPDRSVRTVQLLVDGAVRGTLPYGEARPTECAALPDVKACPNIGFYLEWNTKTVLNGPHVLGVRLTDDRGRAVTIPQDAANGLTVIVAN
ncbi:MAG TPA: hypothetical protein VFL57_21120, partial [Bryobacteraceae bacterium]|nr:hypothetical protein [Bryobacteraceae bacterium]